MTRGLDPGKVFLILAVIVVGSIFYVFSQKDLAETIANGLGEALLSAKVKVGVAPKTEKGKVALRVERPNLKPHSKFSFHYKLYGKNDIVTNAETIYWTVTVEGSQVTWESESHLIEAFSSNPFLPPLSASVSLYRTVPRLDYLTKTDVFPLTASEPKVVRIQDRTKTDSQPYEWSCLVTGHEIYKTIAEEEFPVLLVTCVSSGAQTGIETYKYSPFHNHWIAKERNGFGLPKITAELITYSTD